MAKSKATTDSSEEKETVPAVTATVENSVSPTDVVTAEANPAWPIEATPATAGEKAAEAILKDPPPAADDDVAQPADSSVAVLWVKVRPEWPFKTLVSAGMSFTAVPQQIRSDHPAISELRANPYLSLSDRE